ncbi:MAG: aminotransferase class V-fold PLP-dependent enzyme [Rickettsiales bacterium]|jgi:cysteine desulfurase/selenocysteine lyase|nr:aminotransferase class V-fold PLP-dependent enzyme [Rickettsiales bacterium]
MTKNIYVDAAASSQKPESVIAVEKGVLCDYYKRSKSLVNAETDFLQNHYANAGRGICDRASFADKAISDARAAAAEFIGAKSKNNIIFTSGTTDGLNRVVRILENSGMITSESVVQVSDLDHHSARLPWEDYARRGKCKITVCPLDAEYNIDISGITKSDIFVITAMSNVIGAPQNVGAVIAAARALNPNVITIVDAAQYVVHLPMDVSAWNADFLCFSGHKMLADTGVGIMYIKEPDRWEPDKFGGGMVSNVSLRDTFDGKEGKGTRENNSTSEWTFAPGPAKFEAGTLPLTQIVGLAEAIRIKSHESDSHELEMREYLRAELSKILRIKFISPKDAYILTFVVDGMHPLDFGAMMGVAGVCLRVGNMCASWMHRHFDIDGSIRISVGFWNTMDDMKEIVRIISEIVTNSERVKK